MERLEHIERKALDFVRGAGKYGAHLTHFGLEVAGAADWLEAQIPRVRSTLGAVAAAVVSELRRGTDVEVKPSSGRQPAVWDEERELGVVADDRTAS
jgi:hypothetical protein